MLVDTLDQFIDTLLIFQSVTPKATQPTRRVTLFGNGGGTSVLATDFYARLGLDVTPFAADTLAPLAALQLPIALSVCFLSPPGRVAAPLLPQYQRG